ncbi:Serrate RNA effector molecule [Intoshia linei]|uniref:Serrate RNA effector molecule n=1 Tax=Intoshia linei TaxID=1819745 RepID=A0A177B0C7_9BILA|nr:Serrate RNA effector molecule [Intoshia linei]
MVDSDDNYDKKKTRDKFKRERFDEVRRPDNSHFERSYRSYDEDLPHAKKSRTSVESLMSFKNFTNTLPDSISEKEAVQKYKDYKQTFNEANILKFFDLFKNNDWFKRKYHPDFADMRKKNETKIIISRHKVFKDMFNSLYFEGLNLSYDKADHIIKIIDYATILLEGKDLNYIKDIESKQSKVRVDNGKDESAVEGKDTTEKNDSNDGECPPSDDDGKETPEPLQMRHMESLTKSIFLRNIPSNVTYDEILDIFKERFGFKRLVLQNPTFEKKHLRRGWVTYEPSLNITDECWEIKKKTLSDMTIDANVNKPLQQRVRYVNKVHCHKSVVIADITQLVDLIQGLDKKFDLWNDEDNVVENDNKYGINSKNPLLKNIDKYLIEYSNCEEEALIGKSEQFDVEIDKEYLKVVDIMIMYLRIVYSIDYYTIADYANEHEMPNRCGIIHVRGTHLDDMVDQSYVMDFIQKNKEKWANYKESQSDLSLEEMKSLGYKDKEKEELSFVEKNCKKIDDDKYLCPLSGKKFKAPDFVRKHIYNKHKDKLKEVEKNVIYFNEYLKDRKRPYIPNYQKSPSFSNSNNYNNYNNKNYNQSFSYNKYRGHDNSGYRSQYHSRQSNWRQPYNNNGNYNKSHNQSYNYDSRDRNHSRTLISYKDLDAPE